MKYFISQSPIKEGENFINPWHLYITFPFWNGRGLNTCSWSTWSTYYHIGMRSSHVGNYRTGTADRPQRPSCTYRCLMTLLIGSIRWWCRKTPWVRGRISPDKSPPRSCGILNPPTQGIKIHIFSHLFSHTLRFVKSRNKTKLEHKLMWKCLSTMGYLRNGSRTFQHAE